MILEAKNIFKSYRNGEKKLPVLTDLNLSINIKETITIMGPSGSGKSTLLNIIGLLDTHDSGEYRLDNRIIENMSGLTCPHCNEVIDLFKVGGGEAAAKELGVPFLGRIPINPNIVKSGDSGKPFLLEDPDSDAAKAFNQVIDKIEQFVKK